MDISLSSDNEKFINSQIAKGVYKSINEAINALIQKSAEYTTLSQEEIRRLNEDIEVGFRDIEQGRYKDAKSVMEELRKKYA